MSLYNMLHGTTPATFLVLPMLGKHPDKYPRFRDCFLRDEEHPEYNDHIHVYTRTGGGNREAYQVGNDEIRAMPDFVTDFDDSFDSTFASWVFRVPERWVADFAKIQAGELSEISDAYKVELYRVFPKLADKYDEVFSAKAEVHRLGKDE